MPEGSPENQGFGALAYISITQRARCTVWQGTQAGLSAQEILWRWQILVAEVPIIFFAKEVGICKCKTPNWGRRVCYFFFQAKNRNKMFRNKFRKLAFLLPGNSNWQENRALRNAFLWKTTKSKVFQQKKNSKIIFAQCGGLRLSAPSMHPRGGNGRASPCHWRMTAPK